MRNKSQEKQKLSKKINISKSVVVKLSKIHKKYDEIFEDDKVLLKELKSKINVQHRKAS